METKLHDILEKRLKGENLSQLARDLGISKSLLADWVASRRLPSLKNVGALKKLSNYLGISLEDLLLGHEESDVITSLLFKDGERQYSIQITRIK